jgi:hypothetical protein
MATRLIRVFTTSTLQDDDDIAILQGDCWKAGEGACRLYYVEVFQIIEKYPCEMKMTSAECRHVSRSPCYATIG